MQIFDFSDLIPPEARVIYVSLSTRPAFGMVQIYREVDDPNPVTLGHGETVQFALPPDKIVHVEPFPGIEAFEFAVVNWME